MCGMNPIRNFRNYAVWFGLFALIASATITEIGRYFDVTGSRVLSESLVFFVLVKFFPEPQSVSFKLQSVVLLISAGAFLAGIWVLCIGAWSTGEKFTEWTEYPFHVVALSYAHAVVIAPLFEEKIVRDLILPGVSEKIGSIFGSVLVSIFFALAHTDSMLWAFFFSISMCWLAIKWRLNTYQRAIVHGMTNLIIMLWIFTAGFGVF